MYCAQTPTLIVVDCDLGRQVPLSDASHGDYYESIGPHQSLQASSWPLPGSQVLEAESNQDAEFGLGNEDSGVLFDRSSYRRRRSLTRIQLEICWSMLVRSLKIRRGR